MASLVFRYLLTSCVCAKIKEIRDTTVTQYKQKKLSALPHVPDQQEEEIFYKNSILVHFEECPLLKMNSDLGERHSIFSSSKND